MADSFETLETLKNDFTQPTEFNVNGYYYARITDGNYGTYSNGSLKFNISNLYSSTASDKVLYELSEAYIQLFVTNTLELSGGATFPTNGVMGANSSPLDLNPATNINGYHVDLKNAVCLKDPTLLINQMWINQSGMEIISSSTHQYLYAILKNRCANKEDLEVKASILDRYMDNGTGLVIDPDVGEINNITSRYIAKNVYSTDGFNDKNKLVNRKFVPMGTISNATGLSQSVSQLVEVTMFSREKLEELEIPYFEVVSNTKIVWYDIIKIYIKDLDDYFARVPSTQQIQKFNLVFNTNISDNTSWTIEYSRSSYGTTASSNPNGTLALAAAGNVAQGAEAFNQLRAFQKYYFKPTKLTSNLGNATCCPWLVGDSSLSRNNNLESALSFLPSDTAGQAPVVKISSKIGWHVVDNNNAVLSKSKLQQYLWIPQVKFNPSVMSQIIKNEPYVFFANTATIDINTFVGIKPSDYIKKPLNNTWSHVKNIYLLPMLDGNGWAGSTSLPYESPLTSAPLTNGAGVYLSRIQIYQGGKPLLSADSGNLSPIDYYDNLLFRNMNDFGGNSVLSKASGMLSKYDFRQAYKYYKFDMSQYCSDDVSFATPKSYEIAFKVDSKVVATSNNIPNSINVVVIVEYEKSYKINRFTGEFVQ